MNFQPVNRYLLVKLVDPEKKESQVLLPEDYKPSKEQFKLCEVLKIANDCTREMRPSVLEGCYIVANASMIEEIKVFNETFHLVLENYVMGVVDDVENK
tara:strand:- start:301 stop:597 length:297 start_codon:yes stop_codon:yes gene_type:complete